MFIFDVKVDSFSFEFFFFKISSSSSQLLLRRKEYFLLVSKQIPDDDLQQIHAMADQMQRSDSHTNNS